MSSLHKVVSLGLAQALKERDVPQKSIFFWEYLNEKAYGIRYVSHTTCPRDTAGIQHFSAFTSDELMDILPCFIDTKTGEPFNTFWLEIHKRRAKNIQYCVKYICDTQGIDRYGNLTSFAHNGKNFHDEQLANALAKMLIHLIDNNLYIKIEPIDTSEVLANK